jgi:hypothetical protein
MQILQKMCFSRKKTMQWEFLRFMGFYCFLGRFLRENSGFRNTQVKYSSYCKKIIKKKILRSEQRPKES